MTVICCWHLVLFFFNWWHFRYRTGIRNPARSDRMPSLYHLLHHCTCINYFNLKFLIINQKLSRTSIELGELALFLLNHNLQKVSQKVFACSKNIFCNSCTCHSLSHLFHPLSLSLSLDLSLCRSLSLPASHTLSFNALSLYLPLVHFLSPFVYLLTSLLSSLRLFSDKSSSLTRFFLPPSFSLYLCCCFSSLVVSWRIPNGRLQRTKENCST